VDRLGPHSPEHQQLLRGAELFVTCEPCIMCAAAIRLLGVQRVYAQAPRPVSHVRMRLTALARR
jgi:tRNA(Arg) A34 adenosine deaminase TadA